MGSSFASALVLIIMKLKEDCDIEEVNYRLLSVGPLSVNSKVKAIDGDSVSMFGGEHAAKSYQ